MYDLAQLDQQQLIMKIKYVALNNFLIQIRDFW